MAKPKAIIFDLYGTLIQRNGGEDPFSTIFNELGLTGNARRIAKNRVLTEDTSDLESFIKSLNAPKEIDIDENIRRISSDSVNISGYKETKSMLNFVLENAEHVGLISNLSTAHKRGFYLMGLDEFIKNPVFSCDVGMKKPDPAIYLNELERMGVKPHQALMVGDSLYPDCYAPRKLGINALLVDRSERFVKRIPCLNSIKDYF